MLCWYLVHTKPAGEVIASTHLERQGFTVYLPLIRQPEKRRQQWHETTGPLFPRYLFVGVEMDLQSLAPVRSTKGVSNLVRSGGNYTIVPDRIIHELRAIADPETGLHRIEQAFRLTAGAPVRVAAGPFNGLEGVFQRHSGDERVIILLNILGQAAPVRVPGRFVRPIHAV